MFVAQELRKKSIAEYLFVVCGRWRTLSVPMAVQLPVIRKQYIDRFRLYRRAESRGAGLVWQPHPHDERGRKARVWTSRYQPRVAQGRHRPARHAAAESKFPIYNAEYYKVLPYIVELRNKGDKDVNEIETCLDALYGVMMLRLQKGDNARDSPCRDPRLAPSWACSAIITSRTVQRA